MLLIWNTCRYPGLQILYIYVHKLLICNTSYQPEFHFERHTLQSPQLTVGFKVHHLIELNLMVAVMRNTHVRKG